MYVIYVQPQEAHKVGISGHVMFWHLNGIFLINTEMNSEKLQLLRGHTAYSFDPLICNLIYLGSEGFILLPVNKLVVSRILSFYTAGC